MSGLSARRAVWTGVSCSFGGMDHAKVSLFRAAVLSKVFNITNFGGVVMKRYSYFTPTLLVLIFSLISAASVFGSDQEKADKQLHKITAMASDATGRRVVSATVADALQAKRPDLVIERRAMNVNYGDLYVAHQLVKSGAKMDDLAAQLKAGKKMDQIAGDLHVDWKQMASDAKKLNTKIEDNLYNHFLNGKPLTERDAAEGYDPMIDGVSADSDVSKDEIADAERTYLLWRDRADQKKGSSLDASTEKSAQGNRGDPVRSKAGKLAPPPN
jgi:hypothetical protein